MKAEDLNPMAWSTVALPRSRPTAAIANLPHPGVTAAIVPLKVLAHHNTTPGSSRRTWC